MEALLGGTGGGPTSVLRWACCCSLMAAASSIPCTSLEPLGHCSRNQRWPHLGAAVGLLLQVHGRLQLLLLLQQPLLQVPQLLPLLPCSLQAPLQLLHSSLQARDRLVALPNVSLRKPPDTIMSVVMLSELGTSTAALQSCFWQQNC